MDRSAAASGSETENLLQDNSSIFQELRASVLRNGVDMENLLQEFESNIKASITTMEINLKQEIRDLRSAQADSERAEGGELVHTLKNLFKCKVCYQVAREGGIGLRLPSVVVKS